MQTRQAERGDDSPASLVQKPSVTSVPASRTGTTERGLPRLHSLLGQSRRDSGGTVLPFIAAFLGLLALSSHRSPA